jgi:hypothetical protein
LVAVRGIQQADLKAVEPQVKNDSARSGRGRRWARPRPSVEGEVTASNTWKFPTFFTRRTKPFASIRYTVVYADVLRAGISFRSRGSKTALLRLKNSRPTHLKMDMVGEYSPAQETASR